ncbi:hypothetical protein FO519_003178 [Halicephalobus sp. NKZ332]|nr:hypothetical protein FO519_003178 [Halicephalobus sp. NKZ332]
MIFIFPFQTINTKKYFTPGGRLVINEKKEFEDFRNQFLDLPRDIHEMIMMMLPTNARRSLSVTNRYFNQLSNSRKWRIEKLSICQNSTRLHITADEKIFSYRLSSMKPEEIRRALTRVLNKLQFYSFRYYVHDRTQAVYLADCLPFLEDVREFTLETQTIHKDDFIRAISALKNCDNYNIVNISFVEEIDLSDVWYCFKGMKRLAIRDLTNCNFENDIFHLLCDRPYPNLLQSVIIKLTDKGIHPADIEEFAEKLEHFDREQIAEIRIIFPSNWKIGQIFGEHQEKLGSRVINNYSESIKNNVLVSYFAKDEDTSQHLADNGITFYGEHP